MSALNKTNLGSILAYVNSGLRSVKDVSKHFGVTPVTARNYLERAVSEGLITCVGYHSGAHKGRPSAIYGKLDTLGVVASNIVTQAVAAPALPAGDAPAPTAPVYVAEAI